jgi:hypothetical protein
MLGSQQSFDIRHNWDGRAVSSTRRPHFIPPKEMPMCSFLLEAELNPGLRNADEWNWALEIFPNTLPGIEPVLWRSVPTNWPPLAPFLYVSNPNNET